MFTIQYGLNEFLLHYQIITMSLLQQSICVVISVVFLEWQFSYNHCW